MITWTSAKIYLFYQTFQDFILALGYRTTEFLRECKFQNQHLNCDHITEEVFDKDHGKCFLIRRNFSQSVAGVGLSLVLNINTEEYPRLTPKYRNPPLFDGVYIWIGRKFSPAKMDKILVGPGKFSKISLSATKISLINVKNQPCVESHGEKFESLADLVYSSEACKMECVQKITLDTCRCLLAVDKQFLRPTNFSICHPEMVRNCVMDTVVAKVR